MGPWRPDQKKEKKRIASYLSLPRNVQSRRAILTSASATPLRFPRRIIPGTAPRERANKSTIFVRERREAKIERTRLATSTADDFGGGVLSQTIRFEGNRKEKTARIHRPRPLTDNPGDAGRRSSVRFGLHGPGFLDIPLGAERRSKLPFVK